MNEYEWTYQKQTGKVMADTLIEARGMAQQLIGLSHFLINKIVVRLIKVNGVPYSVKKAIAP